VPAYQAQRPQFKCQYHQKENLKFYFIISSLVGYLKIFFLSLWLMPVILATQEIRRIAIRSQPGQNSSLDPICKKPITKKGWQSDSRCRP
jgi:hypothetical protein